MNPVQTLPETAIDCRSNHTPGPWEARQLDGSCVFNWSVKGADGFSPVASVCTWPGNKIGAISQAEADANASLIASAPCLLQALERWVYWHESPETAERRGITWRDILGEARAAILKAKEAQ